MMKTSLGKELQVKIKNNYIKYIRTPVVIHRENEAKKFQTRIDYVDLSAFGVGVKFSDEDKNKIQLQQMQEIVDKYCSKYGVFHQQMENLNKKVDFVMLHICTMAIRYDERLCMILDKLNYDNFQRDFVARIYQNEDYTRKKMKILNKKTYVKVKSSFEQS